MQVVLRRNVQRVGQTISASLRLWLMQLRKRNVAVVESGWNTMSDLTGPRFEPKTACSSGNQLVGENCFAFL